jgi:peptidoglycan/LPS O-acetylase OafA/YrhL
MRHDGRPNNNQGSIILYITKAVQAFHRLGSLRISTKLVWPGVAAGAEASTDAGTDRSARSRGAGARIYFPELDGLRFIAFLMVFLFHGGLPEPMVGQAIGRTAARALRENGGYGVQLFFILSGYLITTLLLREESRYGRVALRAFWIRRILRIWPLYYLVILIGFFLIPGLDGQFGTSEHRQLLRHHLLPFLGFAGNWSMALIGPAPDWLSVLWSVCVEEQFYLVVPLFIALIAPQFRRPMVLALIVGAIAVRGWCARHSGSQLLIVYNSFAQFDTLLSGVLLAMLLGWDRDRPVLTRWVRWLQWPLYLAFGWIMTWPHLGHGTEAHRTWDFVWVWLCGVGIVVVAVWGKGWLRAALSYSRIVWLGKISYGLYMYHEFALWARGRLLAQLPWFANKEELLSLGALAMTIALAAASYHGYERRFLRLKRAWTRVPSRPV